MVQRTGCFLSDCVALKCTTTRRIVREHNRAAHCTPRARQSNPTGRIRAGRLKVCRLRYKWPNLEYACRSACMVALCNQQQTTPSTPTFMQSAQLHGTQMAHPPTSALPTNFSNSQQQQKVYCIRWLQVHGMLQTGIKLPYHAVTIPCSVGPFCASMLQA